MAHLLEIAVLANSVAFLLFIVLAIVAIRSKTLKTISFSLKALADSKSNPKLTAKIAELEAQIMAVEGKADTINGLVVSFRSTVTNKWSQESKAEKRAAKEHALKMQELDQRMQIMQNWNQAPQQLPAFSQGFPQMPQPTSDGGGY